MRVAIPVLIFLAATALVLCLWLLPRSQPACVNHPAQPIQQTPSPAAVEEETEVVPETREPVSVSVVPPTEQQAPPIPDSLGAVFDEHGGYIARMKAVDALPNNQPPEALAALRWLLRKPNGPEALRNNVANKLRRCGEKHLVSDLTEMAWDERETPKWRNYCVQHLYTCYEEGRDPAILDTLFKAADPAETDEKTGRICAVWSLARVATPRDKTKTPDEAMLERIRGAALAALREEDAHFLITTAGVQSCSRLGLKEALPDIREIAGDDSTKPTHLRVVSLAAVGDLGDETDLPLLDRLSSSAKGQLRSAAAHAAKKVRARTAERKPAAGEGDTPPAEVPKDADGRRDF